MTKQCSLDNCQKEYCFESSQVVTFKNWPCSWMKPKKLAAAGFYYTSRDDNVKCFECNLEISKWEINDNLIADHKRWSRQCRLVNNLLCGYVSISVDPSTNSAKEMDVCTSFIPVSSSDDVIKDETSNIHSLLVTKLESTHLKHGRNL
ncbi:baculoviral IAP repeat-containing protein 2-like [Pseudomyrmex gracilis]|uniref:baculoviral IAP repeat-containing protein 2-like n=1 Tax=Pseudomyrmex gracilis TaxID=219809 RepID=UPI000994D2BA|nr:baculoviral IAP repeat-containing protein 2-like [Pseudomyrmex gracilis]